MRSARSFPFVSKVSKVDLVELSTKAILGIDVSFEDKKINYCGVKCPQFSFNRLLGADPVLGVEMASTGEVACFGFDRTEAYLKAMIATGFRIPKKKILLSIGSFKEKHEFLPSILKLVKMKYSLLATSGTFDFLSENKIPVSYVEFF